MDYYLLSLPLKRSLAEVQFIISTDTGGLCTSILWNTREIWALNPSGYDSEFVPAVTMEPSPLVLWGKEKRELKLCIHILVHSEPIQLFSFIKFWNSWTVPLRLHPVLSLLIFLSFLGVSAELLKKSTEDTSAGSAQRWQPACNWAGLLWRAFESQRLGGKRWHPERGSFSEVAWNISIIYLWGLINVALK